MSSSKTILSTWLLLACFYVAAMATLDIPHNLNAKVDVEPDVLEKLKLKIADSFVRLSVQPEGGATLHLLRIVRATQQLVAGILYDVEIEATTPAGDKTCKLELFEQPWSHYERLEIACENQIYQVVRGEEVAAAKQK